MGNSTIGRMGLPTVYGNDPPELGIPTVPPLPIMHSAPLSALLSHTNSLTFAPPSNLMPPSTVPATPSSTLASASLFNNNSINNQIVPVSHLRLHDSQQGELFQFLIHIIPPFVPQKSQ